MFTQEELVGFRDDMLDVCNKLNVEVDPRFSELVVNSKYLKTTLQNHGCKTTDELIKLIGDWLIERPDSIRKYRIVCNRNSFLASGR